MLVLSRKRNDEIVIGEGADQVKVMVIEIRGDKVRLGIEAPQHVPVHRKEVYDAIQRKNLQKSAESTPSPTPSTNP